MKKIIYYVALSLDGYISGPQNDISMFPHGKGVDKYLEDLQNYKTVIMGRKTYEFGYIFGLKPGKAAYSHMKNYVFSNSLKLELLDDNIFVENISVEKILSIKNNSETDVYLCGGGQFAGWLLENNLIDQLKIKLNPIVLGDGVRLFGNSKVSASWKLINTEMFEEGPQILTYQIC